MSANDTVILVSNYGMGKGLENLQLLLMGKYLSLLSQRETLPAAICFYTEGVKLVIDGSPVMEQLITLEKKGVHLIVCSTCRNYFGLEDKEKVGILGGMTNILEAHSAPRK